MEINRLSLALPSRLNEFRAESRSLGVDERLSLRIEGLGLILS